MYVHKRTYSVHVYYIELHIVWHKNLMVIKILQFVSKSDKQLKRLNFMQARFYTQFWGDIYEVDFYPVYGL